MPRGGSGASRSDRSSRGPGAPGRAALPSVDRVLREPRIGRLAATHGRRLVVEAVRDALAALREELAAPAPAAPGPEGIRARVVGEAERRIEATAAPSLRPVFNLTGTVLHTNLGRAPMPRPAVEAMAAAAAGPVNLEYDVEGGRRGERDAHVERWLQRLTGAEAATVVNNNAAAVLLVLNTLAAGREVPVSRGELIEIGGSFRMPDIMARAGCRLVEVGTTNRTHLPDFERAVGPETAALMAVHTSNYAIQGFTAGVPAKALAALAHRVGLPFVHDLGSGTLVDLERYGLPHEPTAAEAVRDGADLVTFSGDKLLGGPQCGIIVGGAAWVAALNRNPMKRALRLGKVTLAALEATLRLYADPERLPEHLPALRLLLRPAAEIEAAAARVAERLRAWLAPLPGVRVAVEPCRSQIGSGALPVDLLASFAVTLRGGGGGWPNRVAAAFRALPVPVIGRVADDAFVLDVRCLDDEARFLAQLDALALEPPPPAGRARERARGSARC